MPRKRKTQSGADAQSVPDSVPGVRYGEGVEHQQLAAALPPADMRNTPPAAALGPAPAGAVPPTPSDPAMLAKLMAGTPMGALRGTAAPDEPVTAGLASGPGPGPEALRRGPASPLGKTLLELSRSTGDPIFAELARKAGIR